jgi:hypothetical protein
MLEALLHMIVSPFVRLWLRNSGQSWRLLPTPPDRPVAHSAGTNPDSVLLVGAGVAVGYGVRTADLALGGYLARQLTTLTGRGADVESEAALGMRVARAATTLAKFNLSRFDALVLTLGSDEALNLVPSTQFRRDLEALLGWIDVNAPPRMSVVFVGIPHMPSMMKMPALFAGAVGRQCDRLDHELRLACAAHPRAIYAPFTPEPGNLLLDADRNTYAKWAALIAPTVARVLDGELSNPGDLPNKG